ncbi:hypothetical protein [Deinococcus multiflagellatus]|uniref:Uncharacterized protein n=1 Tax=Deinococcus multiflagellatus TaxID=1656887 RepID=A0ABW1ZQW3_9DEIO|nr:hypothetical protein [Deinococcus multiflagellatus]MBZ9715374.1 hypothetical protein [Deinococcus multiflagellatus]
MSQISKPADGTYLYPAPITGTETIATWQDGRLTALVEGGEPRNVITALTEAHTAHEISYLDDVVFTPPAPTIGKALACELHRAMGRAGIRDHYAFASKAVGVEVASLAALWPEELRAVRDALAEYVALAALQAEVAA